MTPETLTEDSVTLQRFLEARSSHALLSREAPAAIARGMAGMAAEGGTAEMDRGRVALRVGRLLAPLGDGYAAASPMPSVPDLGVLPFELRRSARGFVALREDGTFVDPERPILAGIDGASVAEWLASTEVLGAAPSGPAGEQRALGAVRLLGLLRRERGMAYSPETTVLLADAEGGNARPLTLRLADRAPVASIWPRTPSRIIDHKGIRVGYLRIPKMGQRRRGHANLAANLEAVRDTSALVIDLRGNPGKGTSSVMTVLPLLSRPAPMIEAVAAIEVREGAGHSDAELEKRSIFSPSSPRLTGEERSVLERAARSFRPGTLFLLSSPSRGGGRAYSYEGPVAVLIDSGCLDSCELLAAVLKGRPGVTLVGSATGGGGYGIPKAFRLPATGVSVIVSSALSYTLDGKLLNGRPVAPDVFVEPEPADLAGTSDRVLDRALAAVYSSARGGRRASMAPSIKSASNPSPSSGKTKE